MALPASGNSIKMSQIKAELGSSSNSLRVYCDWAWSLFQVDLLN